MSQEERQEILREMFADLSWKALADALGHTIPREKVERSLDCHEKNDTINGIGFMGRGCVCADVCVG